ncbi:MAG: 5-oxoprolinase subunit PxpA [Pseudomonadota bacterium]
MAQLDLNCDLGESYGAYKMGDDEGVMPFISSANIGCGFHGGDPTTIRRAVQLARDNNVSIGAHPSYPDRMGFGLHEMKTPPQALEDAILYQISAVAGIAKAEGARLRHVKPHGALGWLAGRRTDLAEIVAKATAAYDSSLVLYAFGELIPAGRKAGLRIAADMFAGRIYDPDGMPRTRTKPGGLLNDFDAMVDQLATLAKEQRAKASDGSWIDLPADTACVHVEGPDDTAVVKRLNAALIAAGVEIAPTDRA